MKSSKKGAFYRGKLETRSEEGGKRYIEGYFAVFNQKTELWEGVFETILPGAFANSINNNDIRCLFNHDTNFVMGRQQAGTLELKEDEIGLWGRVCINEEDTAAKDIYARVARGDITGCSFGFWPVTEEPREEIDGILWAVEDTDTFEVSICPFPQYEETEIQARDKEYRECKERTAKLKLRERKQKLKKRIGKIK